MNTFPILRFIAVFGLFLALPTYTSAINHYYKGDTLYAWGVGGLNIREKGSLKAEKIGSIPYGEKVIVLESKFFRRYEQKLTIIKGKPTSEYPNRKDIALRGRWVLVEFKGVKGYVFDAYLSYFIAPEVGKEDVVSLMDSFSLKAFGLVYKKTFENEEEEDDVRIVIEEFYNFGVSCRSTGGKIGQSIWLIPSLSFEEIILLYKNGVKPPTDFTDGIYNDGGLIHLGYDGGICEVETKLLEGSFSGREIVVLVIQCSC